ncbi:hypothetical protein [Bacillus mesophilum]|uniref:Uncharacterized protein n=1 Tax=Bacillus mesophilum TaxID=1071718 RepID=A0A7V7RM12_9BACI|nr:hypothetical protein [Bacillus mesophilum]KAB2332939.1 hypothetical protein F7732_12725 [Bacillus mesophilum]
MDKNEILKKLEMFYDEMSDEQFKKHFENSGLEVFNDEKASMVLEDYDKFELPYPVKIKKKSTYNMGGEAQKKWEMDLTDLRKVI